MRKPHALLQTKPEEVKNTETGLIAFTSPQSSYEYNNIICLLRISKIAIVQLD